ncbi:hypothetical protein [Fluviispira sanaruensis]|uniref:Uncharacterized protein n=1 Tax=Fluviispira sanaruensis TaxID=2493639 RepID=A0A4P2VH28_FLUSA|nr:hypothetical protein [Fluviispira sanaruensis]BBH52243.1 hypothetical protein JCM31447_06830 [Fluviispira sanaruensis]
MRKKIELYPDLFCQYSIHEYSDELKKISEILEQHEEMLDWVHADLLQGKMVSYKGRQECHQRWYFVQQF